IEPPDRIRQELAHGECPGLTELQELGPGDLDGRIRWVALDQCQFARRDARMLRGMVVQGPPYEHPEQSTEARHDERGLPSPGNRQDRYDRRRDHRTDIGAGVEQTRRQRPLLLWEPLG